MFDDSRTLLFSSGVNIYYPTLLPLSSTFTSSFTSSLTGSILTGGIVRKGIADRFVVFKKNEGIFLPFKESELFGHDLNGSTDPFYLTGSSIEDVGFGFTSKLASKTVIQININPIAEYSASIKNGEELNGYNPATDTTNAKEFIGTENYPMMYFNFHERSWQGIGRGLPTSLAGTPGQNERSLAENIVSQMYGFSPSYAIFAQNDGYFAASPFSNFGFPLHPKFHATGSQLFHLSGVIDGPFLVEKIVYEFSASYSTGSLSAHNDINDTTSKLTEGTGLLGDEGTPISTFFILNQRGPFQGKISYTNVRTDGADGGFDKVLTASIPSSMQLSKNGPNIYVDTIRDIVTYAQVSALQSTYTDSNRQKLARDLNINCVDKDKFWSGSYVLSASVRSPASNAQISTMFAGVKDQPALVKTFYTPGGRNGTGELTGRDLTSSVIGNQVSSSFNVTEGSFMTYTVTLGTNRSKTNAYILLPTDKLVFGWQVPLGRRMYAEGYGDATQELIASSLKMLPGKGTLKLYGSRLRRNEEFHDSLNQLLTSNAIHEDVQSAVIADQFETEPRTHYSGTFYDDYITGSVSTNSLISRRRVSRVLFSGSVNDLFGLTLTDGAENRARIPGLARSVSHVSENERFYDTLMPRIDKITVINGGRVYNINNALSSNRSNVIFFGLDYPFSANYEYFPDLIDILFLTNYADFAVDRKWDRAFPYEAKYSTVPRDIDVISYTEATHRAGTRTPSTASGYDGDYGAPLTSQVFEKFLYARILNSGEALSTNNFYPQIFLSDPDGTNAVGVFPSSRNTLLHTYGIGTLRSGTMNEVVGYATRSFVAYDEKMRGAIFRGFKYGIYNALPEFTKSMFRQTKFGNFRDMLEQRIDTKFYDTLGLASDGTKNGGRAGVTTSPVQIKFVQPRSVAITQPYKTFSSNMSFEATSSVPYFDGLVRNREEPLNISQINSASVV
jgi:hypothetical protein